MTNICIILAYESLTIGLLPVCSGVALRMFRVFTNIVNGMSEKPKIFKIINDSVQCMGGVSLPYGLNGVLLPAVRSTAGKCQADSREESDDEQGRC